MELIKKYILSYDLHKKNKKRHLVYTRAYLYAYLRYTYNLPLEKIGDLFNKDHATVLHGLKLYDFFKDDNLFIEMTGEARKEFTLGVMKNDTQAGCVMFEILARQDMLIKKNLKKELELEKI